MEFLVCSKDSHADAGAAGGIGQPLALLLKGSSLVGELSLYDIVGTEGVAADLSHIDSSVKVALPDLQTSVFMQHTGVLDINPACLLAQRPVCS